MIQFLAIVGLAVLTSVIVLLSLVGCILLREKWAEHSRLKEFRSRPAVPLPPIKVDNNCPPNTIYLMGGDVIDGIDRSGIQVVKLGKLNSLLPPPTEEDLRQWEERKKEFESAVALAERLRDASQEHDMYYHFAKMEADKYYLWPEVCWSAGLKEGISAEEFDFALDYGLAEWIK